jgi:uncharacterized integral membrane protein
MQKARNLFLLCFATMLIIDTAIISMLFAHINHHFDFPFGTVVYLGGGFGLLVSMMISGGAARSYLLEYRRLKNIDASLGVE